jgi:uncharacterized lipoprotein YddW (UPF0748 family)
MRRGILSSVTSGMIVMGALGPISLTRANADPLPPAAPREFRAAWVATVDNIDWPSKKGLPAAEQQKEIREILDRAVELKLNCLIVQIRTTADALYPSKLEPWSAYLSGTQGVPPSPMYDPLKMWIDEGHARGIEIHAWFNPYRARFSNNKLPLAASHIGKRRPDLVKAYGPYLWLDPGEPDSAKHSLAVFNDVVRRYDVDGIHIDDYFYPYPVNDKGPDGKDLKTETPFPDDESWAKYKKHHPVKPNPATAPADVDRLARDDWRRQSVSDLIRDIYYSTKKINPRIKFGISPFGIGRPGTAPGIKGFDQYEKLYADAALWLNKGWCDYYTPQLYWPIAKTEQSFPVLVDYWRSENTMGRHIWPGLFTSKLADKPKPSTKPSTVTATTSAPATQPATQPWLWSAKEIADQIEVTRAKTPDDPGVVHFSMKALQRNFEGVSTLLKSETYATDALVPATPWLDDKAPPTPTVRIDAKAKTLVLKPGSGEPTWMWAVWTRTPAGWQFKTLPGATRSKALDPAAAQVVVTAVDRCGNESERVSILNK